MKFLHNKIPPPVIALVIGLSMWGLSRYFPQLEFHLSGIIYLSSTLILLGITLDILSFFNFRKKKTTVNPIKPEKAAHLVIDGFYRFTRNPMYLGMLLILTGSAFLFSNLIAFIFLPIFIIIINTLQIKPEEVVLEKIFKEQYVAYKTQVRRWL